MKPIYRSIFLWRVRPVCPGTLVATSKRVHFACVHPPTSLQTGHKISGVTGPVTKVQKFTRCSGVHRGVFLWVDVLLFSQPFSNASTNNTGR